MIQTPFWRTLTIEPTAERPHQNPRQVRAKCPLDPRRPSLFSSQTPPPPILAHSFSDQIMICPELSNSYGLDQKVGTTTSPPRPQAGLPEHDPPTPSAHWASAARSQRSLWLGSVSPERLNRQCRTARVVPLRVSFTTTGLTEASYNTPRSTPCPRFQRPGALSSSWCRANGLPGPSPQQQSANLPRGGDPSCDFLRVLS